jgi:hypothetical protein
MIIVEIHNFSPMWMSYKLHCRIFLPVKRKRTEPSMDL